MKDKDSRKVLSLQNKDDSTNQAALSEDQLKNFALDLVNSSNKTDGYSSNRKPVQTASLANFKARPILRIEREEPSEESGQVIKFAKTKGVI